MEWSKMRLIAVPLISIFLTPMGCSLLGGEASLKRADDYRITKPKTWRSVEAEDSDYAFRLRSGNIVTVTSSCEKHSSAALELLTRHLLIGTRDIKYRRRERIRVSGVEGLHTSVTAQLKGVPFWFELFVISKNRCVFDFSLVSPREIPVKDVGEFLGFVKSFRYGKN